ncbi:MAG: beta-N-acetylhexosaminidase [Deltaproteobacteria bacterium]|nr:beta-N-acetylhexosaminidase [Deltaproteobacteria bacterium]
MANIEEIKKLVGQLFIVGFNGEALPAEFKKLIEEYHLGGTIYFKRNVVSPAQLAELSNDIQFSCRPKDCPPLFISIDHEGGKVNRLVKPFTKFPGNDYLGELGSPKVGFEFGMIIGKELKAVGINVNYAPVVDVNTNRDNPVIRNRSFSSDPEVCAKLGSTVCRGIQKMGVMSVAKHFPGHGDTKEDSHHSLPKYAKPLSELKQVELVPFLRVIRSRVEGVMTGHLFNTELDTEFPATLSEKTIAGLLRSELRFSKVVFSDDMEMKAILDHFTPEQAALLAVNAGVDALIYRGDEKIHMGAMEALIRAVEDGALPLAKLEAANQRILAAKKLYAESKSPIDITDIGNYIGLPEHFQLADKILRKELPAEEEPSR